MSTRQLIEEAEKFLRSNQPNVACLYMNKALKELAKR